MMLSIKNISKGYMRISKRITVLENFSLEAEGGEFLLVSGVSGSGKSTLLAVASGFLRPDEGTVVFEGEDLYGIRDRRLSELHNTKIAYVPQSNTMLNEHTVLGNVLLPFSFSGRKGGLESAREKACELLGTLGLGDQANKFPFELSGGQQRRAVLARALVTGANLLVCDEITNGLDEVSCRKVLGFLRSYAEKGGLVIAASHAPLVKEYSTGEINF